MRFPGIVCLLVLLPWLTACEVATPPARRTPYEFAIRLDDGLGSLVYWREE